MKHTTFTYICLVFVLGLLCSGCSDRPEAWGVLLWAENESVIRTGTLVAVYGSSELNSTYTIGHEEEKERYEVEDWRLDSFKKQRDAELFGNEYAAWAKTFAKVERDGLRVRKTPDADAPQVYKFFLGEIVKIVGRLDEKSIVGEYEGYWFEVLTSEGDRGFTFGEFLEINSLGNLSSGEVTEETDEFLESFFGTVFRPDSYLEMRRTGRYDLEKFLPEYGVFADAENQTISIVTDEQTYDITYTEITRPTEDTYAFLGSSLILTVHPDKWLWFNIIGADSEDERYSIDFVYFPEDIELLTTQEIDRRTDRLLQLMENGDLLSSSAFGSVLLREDGTFEWEGYERLVPDVISAKAAGMGIIDFPLYLDEEIAGSYDGAIAFDFVRDDPEVNTETIRFLYTFGNGGVRFTFVPESRIEENLIKAESPSSTILFFTYTS